jgi:hypothetical protein
MADYENVDVTGGGLSAGVPLKVTGGGSKGALANVQAPTGVLMSDKDTSGILANMQRLAAELESPGHKLLSGLKDMTAWTQYNKGPAFALREEANTNDRNTLYSIRQQQAALQAAQLQAQAENNRINQLMKQGTSGAGGAGGNGLPDYVITALNSVNPNDVAAKNAILSNYYKQNVNKTVEFQNNPATYTTKPTFIPEIGKELDLNPFELKTYTETKKLPERYQKMLGGENIPTGTANTPSAATGQGNLSKSTRQNNPGNLVDPRTGEIRTYRTPEEGDAALTQDLQLKLSGQSPVVKERFGQQVGNFMSPALLAETWAPSTAKGNTPESTQNYGKAIADALGMSDPTAQMPNTPEALAKAKMAITKFEAGSNYPTAPVPTAPAPTALAPTAPAPTAPAPTAPAPTAPAPTATAPTAPASVSAQQNGLVLPFPNPINSKEVDANVKAQEDFRKKNLDVRKGEEVEGIKVMSAIQSKAKDRDQIRYAADTIIEEATRHPKAFAYQQQGGPFAMAASLPVVGGAISDVYAAGAGDAKTRQRVNTAADLLGVENTKDLFGGIGARIGAQLMNVGRSAKGVGTDISAEDNLRRATFIKLGIDKVDEQAAAWKAFKDAGGVNGFDFLQSPENRAIETKYENILKQKFPSEYEIAAQPNSDKFEYRVDPVTGKKQMRKKSDGQ